MRASDKYYRYDILLLGVFLGSQGSNDFFCNLGVNFFILSWGKKYKTKITVHFKAVTTKKGQKMVSFSTAGS